MKVHVAALSLIAACHSIGRDAPTTSEVATTRTRAVATSSELRIWLDACPLRNLSVVPGGMFVHAVPDGLGIARFARVNPDGSIDARTHGQGDRVLGEFPRDAWVDNRGAGQPSHWNGSAWVPTASMLPMEIPWLPQGSDFLVVSPDGKLQTKSGAPAAFILPGVPAKIKAYDATLVDGVLVVHGAYDGVQGYVFVPGQPAPIAMSIFGAMRPSLERGAKHVLVPTFVHDEPSAVEISRAGVRSIGTLPAEPVAVHTSAAGDDWLVTREGSVWRRSTGASTFAAAGTLPARGPDSLPLTQILTAGPLVWIIWDGAVHRAAGGALTPVAAPNGVGDRVPLELVADRDQRVWVAYVKVNDPKRETVLATTGAVDRVHHCDEL